MDKTSIETMKSVIQDWLGQCETAVEAVETSFAIFSELEKQTDIILEERFSVDHNGMKLSKGVNK